MTNNLYRIFHTCFVYIRVSSPFIVIVIRDIIIYLFCYKTRAFGMSYSEKDKKYIFRICLLYQLFCYPLSGAIHLSLILKCQL